MYLLKRKSPDPFLHFSAVTAGILPLKHARWVVMYSLYKVNLLASLSCYTRVRPKPASGWLWVLLVVAGGQSAFL